MKQGGASFPAIRWIPAQDRDFPDWVGERSACHSADALLGRYELPHGQVGRPPHGGRDVGVGCRCCRSFSRHLGLLPLVPLPVSHTLCDTAGDRPDASAGQRTNPRPLVGVAIRVLAGLVGLWLLEVPDEGPCAGTSGSRGTHPDEPHGPIGKVVLRRRGDVARQAVEVGVELVFVNLHSLTQPVPEAAVGAGRLEAHCECIIRVQNGPIHAVLTSLDHVFDRLGVDRRPIQRPEGADDGRALGRAALPCRRREPLFDPGQSGLDLVELLVHRPQFDVEHGADRPDDAVDDPLDRLVVDPDLFAGVIYADLPLPAGRAVIAALLAKLLQIRLEGRSLSRRRVRLRHHRPDGGILVRHGRFDVLPERQGAADCEGQQHKPHDRLANHCVSPRPYPGHAL